MAKGYVKYFLMYTQNYYVFLTKRNVFKRLAITWCHELGTSINRCTLTVERQLNKPRTLDSQGP